MRYKWELKTIEHDYKQVRIYSTCPELPHIVRRQTVNVEGQGIRTMFLVRHLEFAHLSSAINKVRT